MDYAISPDSHQNRNNSVDGGAVALIFFAALAVCPILACCSCCCSSRPNVPKAETNDDSTSADDDDRAAGDAAPIQIVNQRDALPLCTFHRLKDAAAAASSCTICLADYKGGEDVRMMPECCHVFHQSCIDPRLRIHATCPTCRNSTPPVQ